MTINKYNIAVVGATGNVGREVLNLLSERNFPINNIYALASEQSVGKEVSYGENRVLKADAVKYFDFKKSEIVFFCAGSKVSKEYIPKALKAKNIVIDKSSYYRMSHKIPLLVPEVNGKILENKLESNLLASPNCIAIPLSLVLAPLYKINVLKRVVMSTYQSVSGAGKLAMDELFRQTKSSFMNEKFSNKALPNQIAFNIIPAIDSFNKDGSTGEEVKIVQEVQKILGKTLPITATCVRVPVFVGHCISVNIEFKKDIDLDAVIKLYSQSKGVRVIAGSRDRYVTPIDIVGEDAVTISRIRLDNSIKNAINLWVACDNLRKGAGLNAVQIAEGIISSSKS